MRGPWTPSTRLSSMSLVALGPLIQVSGRGGVEAGHRVGYVGDDLVGADDADVHVGDQRDRAAALAGAVVEDDGAGLGDADGRVGDDGGAGVELGGRQPVVDDGVGDVDREAGGHDDAAVGQRGDQPVGELARACSARRRRGSRRPARRRARPRRSGDDPAGIGGRGVGAVPARADRTRPRISSRALVAGPSSAASVGTPPPGAERLARRPRQVAGAGPAGGPDVPNRAATPVPSRANRSASPSRRPEREGRGGALHRDGLRGGTPPRWASTTWARRSTRTDGMSMRTGQTSKQAPHSEEA